MDKISIIVPVYNVDRYLKRCVDSLLKQTYENIEIILVNDCSPDNSAQIISEYEMSDSRVKGITQPQNMGVSAARNRGLEEASGEWIAFCDGDDWYLTEFCEEMLNSAKENGSDFVICDYQLVSDNGPSVTANTLAPIKNNLSRENLIACGPIYSCTHLVKKELFQKSGVKYPLGIGHSEELPVFPVLAKYAEKASIVDKPLYCYYQRSNEVSASNSVADYEDQLLGSISKMEVALGENYKPEILFHVTYNLFYGEILRMCKRGESKKKISERIKKYEMQYPLYHKSPYYKNFGLAKRIFLFCERHRFYLFMRLIAKLHSLLIH